MGSTITTATQTRNHWQLNDVPYFSKDNHTNVELKFKKDDGNISVDKINDTHSSDRMSSDNKDEMRMVRQVGLFSAVALVIGNIIGSGIFVSPGYLLASAGSPGLCLVLWGVCGVYSLLGAIAYCEIGTLIPKSGGEYIYFLEAFGPTHKFFGPMLAFIYAWVSIFLLSPSSVAILALSFAEYVSSPILTAIHFCPDPYLYYVINRLIASLCIGIIAFVNCYSVTAATRVQNIFTVAKLAAIAIVIGGGLYYLCLGYTENLEIGFEGSATSFGQIATAFYGGLWAYSGWNNLNYITEEIKNPYRNLPFAIIIALPLTTILYVLINVSYFTVLTPQEIITSDAVAVDWGIEVLGPASFLIPLGVVMSIFGATNGTVFTSGRISHVAGREGHAPDFLSYIHIEKKTPVTPVLLTSLLATIMIIPGDIASLIDFFGFTISMFYCAAMVALIVMRFTKKDEHRPIKVPIIIPIIVMVISAILVVAPIAVEPQVQYFYALLFILAGLIFYVPFVYYNKMVPGIGPFTIFLQKLLKVVPTTSY
ncbi:b(0,+)-type amino acid transporter 1-like isoform X1 [Daphnia pulex]|uniref:b(0,+)-type amino acid transporter 1-like isoform X1 n=1 Tax=Daphnia pulex TaxID=6669 RepID=UPI001EDEC8DF|nr:b(0,+)-type amino acid transporter 1-like isoform X1 [Daphnia pulex]